MSGSESSYANLRLWYEFRQLNSCYLAQSNLRCLKEMSRITSLLKQYLAVVNYASEQIIVSTATNSCCLLT